MSGIDPFISFEEALPWLNLTPTSVTEREEVLIRNLIDATTSVIISYCNQDPRVVPDESDDDPEDCSVLGFVSACLLQRWFPRAVNQNAGIEEQSFSEMSVKFVVDDGLDGLSKQMLNRYRYISVV